MNKKRILLLVNKKEDQYFPNSGEYEILSVYDSNTFLNRVIRKIVLRYFNFLSIFLFLHWIEKAKEADVIILFDIGNAREIISFIKRTCPNKRIIFWYWNTVSHDSKEIAPPIIKKCGVELWSFDKNDCVLYGMNYNTQFYFTENKRRAEKQLLNNLLPGDVFFCGRDKKRKDVLTKLAGYFDKSHISYLFYLVKPNKKSEETGNTIYYPVMPYPYVLLYIENSRVIIDLVSEDQNGLTLRPLEALFFHKKLITNMITISDYKIYNPNNIFILGRDDLGRLREFIYTEYDMTNHDELTDFYSLETWISRFSE